MIIQESENEVPRKGNSWQSVNLDSWGKMNKMNKMNMVWARRQKWASFFLCVTLQNQEMNRSDYLSEFVSIMTIKLHRESRSRSTHCQHAIPYRYPRFTSIWGSGYRYLPWFIVGVSLRHYTWIQRCLLNLKAANLLLLFYFIFEINNLLHGTRW